MLIGNYLFKQFGFTLPAAWAEVQEITFRKESTFYDQEDVIENPQKDAMITLRVWASEEAHRSGLQPLETTQRFFNMDFSLKSTLNHNILESLFTSSIKTETEKTEIVL